MSLRALSHPLLPGGFIRRLIISPSASHRARCHGGVGAAAAAAKDTIIIPARIQRSSTDILKALSGTITRDTTGPHYKYEDDPYLSPHSNLTKRSYALSKESGRKAARWIREKHPHLFTHTPDDPLVESFHPKVQYGEEEEEGQQKGKGKKAVVKNTNIGAETLAHVIARGEVTNAITVYNICKKRGIALGDEVLQALFELLCFYNSDEPLEAEWVEERWFRQTSSPSRNTWKDNGLAEELFASLTHLGAPVYCSLIRGMAQYYQVDRAWQVYQECREKGIALDTGTYNALIRVASFLRDASDLRWQLIKELLSAMSESGIQPDLGTLNGTLEALSQFAGWRQAKDISLQVLAEFHQQNVTPSLATYFYLLNIHCRERGPRSAILLDILEQIEGRTFTLQDSKDTFFFVTAMEVARNHLRSLEAAQRIDNLLHQGDNYTLIGDSYKESVYYRHFFALTCASLPINEFMEVYDRLVPHIYTPEPGVMQEVLQAVSTSGALEHLPKLWSDMIIFEHSSREKLVSLVLSALTQHYPGSQDQELTSRLATIAKDVWERVQDQDPNRRNRLTLTGQMVGDVVEVLARSGHYSTAQKVLREVTESPQTFLGFVTANALQVFLDVAVEKLDSDTALAILLYSQDAGHQETGQMAIKVRASLPLTPEHRAKISSMLGGDFLTPDTPPSAAPLQQPPSDVGK